MTDDLHHLAGAYALDALDEAERVAFEAHASSCELCAEEVRDFRATAAVLASGAAVVPPADLKARVLADVGQVRQVGPIVDQVGEVDEVDELAARRTPTRARTGLRIAAAAAALLLVGGIIGSRFGSTNSGTSDLLAAPDAVVTNLDGSVGNLRVVWSAERDQIAVVGNGLEDLDEAQTYELWFLLDDGVAPAALFRTDDGVINQIFEVEDINGAGFGVTVEPAAGSDQPTGDVIYVATI